MHHKISFYLGICFLIYGTIKIIFCYCELTPQSFHNFKITNKYFTKHPEQKVTIADQFIFITLGILAILTLIKGASWSGLIKVKLSSLYFLMINAICGCFIIIFYTIVLNTNWISKNEERSNVYMGVGLCAGITYIAMIPVLLYYRAFFQHKKKNSLESLLTGKSSILILSFTLTILTLSYFLQKSGEYQSIYKNIDLTMIATQSILS